MGVDRFVGSSAPGGVMTIGGVVTTRPVAASPLLQLSNLIISSAKTPITTSTIHNENTKEAVSKDSSITSTTSTCNTTNTASVSDGSIMSTPKIMSPGTRKPRPPTGLAGIGVPGVPGSGHLDNRLNQLKPGQRADLGTVGAIGNRPRPTSLGTVPGRGRQNDQKIGTVGWTSLGRKGGLM